MKKTAARNVLLLAVVIGLIWLTAISALAEEGTPLVPPPAGEGTETPAGQPERSVFTVTYLDAGGAVLRREQVTEGEPIHDPGLRPAREGYAFAHWYDATQGTARFVFGAPATKNLTLTPYLTEIVLPEEPGDAPHTPAPPTKPPAQYEQEPDQSGQEPGQPGATEPPAQNEQEPDQSGQEPEQPGATEPPAQNEQEPDQSGQEPGQPGETEPPAQYEQEPDQSGQEPEQPGETEPPASPPALDTSDIPGLEIVIIPNDQADAPEQGEDPGDGAEDANGDSAEPEGNEEQDPQDPEQETSAPGEGEEAADGAGGPNESEGEDGAPADELPADPQASAETLYVSASMDAGSEVRYGQVITLTAVLTGNGDQPFEAFWEYDDGTGWARVESASGLTYSFELNEQNYAWKWRLAVKLLPGV